MNHYSEAVMRIHEILVRIRFRVPDPRIHTFDLWIRIREAQKHMDPSDPDPQNFFLEQFKN